MLAVADLRAFGPSPAKNGNDNWNDHTPLLKGALTYPAGGLAQSSYYAKAVPESSLDQETCHEISRLLVWSLLF
jgi:hypothetical protein